MLDVYTLTHPFGDSNFNYVYTALLYFVLSRLFLLIRGPSIPDKAPPLVSESVPILGSYQFFTARWDFLKKWLAKTSSISFLVGPNHVIAVSGDSSRAAFFESRELNLQDGYALLAGGGASTSSSGEDFNKYFGQRIIKLLKKENFVHNLPNLITDVKSRLSDLAEDKSGMTDPFVSILEIVFQLTMRTVGCNEVANDRRLLVKTMAYDQTIEKSGTMTAVMFPWLPTPAVVKRLIAGAKMYRIFDKVIKERKRTGKRDNDALQFLIDQGDSTTDIIQFVIGSLFAGLLNSGVNAAWILVYLASNPEWMSKIREEIKSTAAEHSSDPSAPLIDQLSTLPVEAWETGFPLIDLCLRESIRLQMVGTAMRKNTSGHDIKIGDAIVPHGSYLMYPLADIHHDPTVYQNSETFDPSRFLEDRAEDKKKSHAYLGWGVSRHPCLGMRFAKLENSIITAFFLAMFDYELVDPKGQPMMEPPRENMNGFTSDKPKIPVRLEYKLRE